MTYAESSSPCSRSFLAAALMFSRRFSQRVKRVFDLALLRPLQPIAQRVYHALQVYRHSYRALALNVALSAGIVVVTTCVWYVVAPVYADEQEAGYVAIGEFRAAQPDSTAWARPESARAVDVAALQQAWESLPPLDRGGEGHAVTTARWASRQLADCSITSRVVPATGVTMARLEPVMRLNSVDFPTLGRPTTTTFGMPF